MAKGIITTKYLESLGVESETAAKIFAERGKEIAETNATIADLENQLKESKNSIDQLNAEFEKLKSENASGAEWKNRYETLKTETEEKAKQAEADRVLREKESRNREYFNNALNAIGKKSDDWNGKFTADGYYNEFVKAIESEENAGKAHKDILFSLVKDDQNAFKGVTVAKLAGGTPTGNGKYSSREDILNIKDTAERQNEMLHNPQFFPELNE